MLLICFAPVNQMDFEMEIYYMVKLSLLVEPFTTLYSPFTTLFLVVSNTQLLIAKAVFMQLIGANNS